MTTRQDDPELTHATNIADESMASDEDHITMTTLELTHGTNIADKSMTFDEDDVTMNTSELTHGTTHSAVSGSSDEFLSSFTLKRRSDGLSGEYNSRGSTISTRSSRSSRESLRENAMVQELTINKLNYGSVGLVGREREVETLQSCFTRMSNEQDGKRRKEFVLIKGHSGVGKSMLANTLEESVAACENGLLARGKFDFNSTDQPYSAIAEAFGEICRVLQDTRGPAVKGKASSAEVGDTILSELGSEVGLLQKLIPELAGLLPVVFASRVVNENFNFEAGQERWRYAFRVLTRILSLHFSPLVLILEDLQWADVSSLEVIDFLISDTLNPSPIMIVGTYRSYDVDVTHILFDQIQCLSPKQEKFEFSITEIELQSFEVSDVNNVIMEMLDLDNEDTTRGLAEICLKRTLGNPYFLIEFITMLEEEGLVSFNLGLLKWVWDEEVIENETMTTANVVDLLEAKMKRLPDDVQLLSQYAACLGSTFKLSTLNLIWNEHVFSEKKTAKVTSLLTVLEEGNFIESCGIRVYRWVHDKIQEVALSLGDASKASFQFEIGFVLYSSLDIEGLEDTLFDVVNLINKGNKKGRPEFASLNLRAAEKARSMSAFHSATKYVSNGIRLLPKDMWTSSRNLTLRLHTIGAEMELALGHVTPMEQYIDTVLSRDDCSTVDKFPLHMSKVYKLCTVDLKYDETIEYCLAVLKELDCKMIFNRALLPVQAILSLISTVKMAKKLTKDDYQNLKSMSDPKDKAIMLLAQRLTIACYLNGSPKNGFLLITCLTKMVQVTLKKGVGSLAGPSFATLGLLTVAALGDFGTAAYFCEVALLLQKRGSSKYAEAITLFNSHASCLAWTMPISSCLPPISEAYNAGMQSGNTEQAMWALQVYNVWMPYQMGRSLGVILEECPNVALQTEEVQQHEQRIFLSIFWQMMLNLTGRSEETTKLKGDIFDCDTFENKTDLQDALFHLAKLELMVFFGDFEAAAKLALARGDKYEKAAPGYFLGMLETFHRGVALYAMARRTKKRKYKTAAKGILKIIATWVKSGNPNVRHYHALLMAEQAALDMKHKEAESLYKDAVVLSARTGHMHHAGLINERYSDFLLQVLGDEEEATFRRGEAIRFYEDWGAHAMVDRLTNPLS